MSDRPPRPGRPGAERRRMTHSIETVLAEAVALLDEGGEPALTFRALAARLGGGAASIYWYVANKDELLDRATDDVMGRLLERTADLAEDPDPVVTLRALSLALFDEMRRRPWFGTYMLRNTGLQPNSMLMFDRIGQQLMRLDLTPKQQFHAASSLVSYIVGVAADMAQPPPKEFVDSGLEPAAFLELYADRWRALDPEDHPFAHHVADEFAHHDDEDVFRSGLDLLLAGIRVQARGSEGGPAGPRG